MQRQLRVNQVAASAFVSPGYLSRIELGQVDDGPSLAVLERLAEAINVPTAELTRRKAQDVASSNAPEVTAQSNNNVLLTNQTVEPAYATPLTAAEEELLRITRSSGQALQSFLVATAQTASAMLSGDLVARGVRAVINSVPGPSVGIKLMFSRIADAYFDLGERIMNEALDAPAQKEALPAYQAAEEAYRHAGSLAGAADAMSCRAAACHSILFNYSGADEEYTYYLEAGIRLCILAEDLYTAAAKSAVETRDKYLSRFPKTLSLHAELLDLMRQRIARHDADQSSGIRTARLLELEEHGFDLRMKSIDQLGRLINQLDNDTSLVLHLSTNDPFSPAELLPTSLNRRAKALKHLYMQLDRSGQQQVDTTDRDPAFAANLHGRGRYLQATQIRDDSILDYRKVVEIRRTQLGSGPKDAVLLNRLEKLVRAHQELGHALQAFIPGRSGLHGSVRQNLDRLDTDSEYLRYITETRYQYRLALIYRQQLPDDFDVAQLRWIHQLYDEFELELTSAGLGMESIAVIDRLIDKILTPESIDRRDYPLQLSDYTTSA